MGNITFRTKAMKSGWALLHSIIACPNELRFAVPLIKGAPIADLVISLWWHLIKTIMYYGAILTSLTEACTMWPLKTSHISASQDLSKPELELLNVIFIQLHHTIILSFLKTLSEVFQAKKKRTSYLYMYPSV